MSLIEAALAASDVAGILMCGGAGVGKSRIAREASTTATAQGYECRWVVGTSSAQSVPLGAFTGWATSDTTDTVGLLGEVIRSLTSTPSRAPVVVCVDDVHLLDELSMFVVYQVVQRGAAKVILTVRDEPNIAAIREILKLGQFDRLDLQPLTAEETSTLLSTVLGGPVDPDAAQRLWTLTQGNALYLQNIVEQEIADGRLVNQHGSWQWTGDPVMPPGLVELIESRIGTLPTSVGDVVDALAVGEPIELAALQRITAPSAVEDADTRGLITLEPVAGGMEVRVAHPLYGEVRRRRAPETRLRRLRGLVATELADAEDRDDIRMVVRRAALSLDSDLPPDPDLLVRAAHGAVWLADLPLADRLAEAAIRAGAGPEPSLVRAHALSWLGHGEQAEEILAGIDPDALPETERARLTFLRASNLMWALGAPAEAKRLADEASGTFSPQARIYTDAFLAVHAFATDDPQAAAHHLEHLALEQLPPVVGAEIAWVLTATSADAGRTTAAIAAAETGYTVADRSFDAPQMRFNIADAHLSALLLSGHIHDALALSGRVRAQAANLPGTAALLGAAVAGRSALGAGDLPTACALLAQATSGLSRAGYLTGWAYRYQVTEATALAMRGATDDAVAHLAALDERPRRFRLLDYERAMARAWVAAGQGVVSEAISVALVAAEQARGKGQFAAEVLCRQTAAQFGDRCGAARLRELEALVEGPRAGLAARLAEALQKSDAAELSDVSAEFETIGDLVAAIDCAAHASLVYRVQGLRGSSLKCSTRATDLAERCGGINTPALRAAAETLPLTNREREIVMLIAEGLSNQAIAARLTLSVRTVESHIYRAMLKTETTSREDIAGLLRHKKYS